MKIISILLLSLISISGFSQYNTMANKIDQVVQTAIQKNKIVGTVIIVAQDGKIIYEKASGYSDLEQKTPMKTDAIFLLASVTKPMVSAVVMKFAEDGKLKLSDPVTKYLPDFQPKLSDGKSPEITIHQLLTHTSGLSYRFLEDKNSDYYTYNVSDGLDQPGLSLKENLNRLSKTKLKFEPGTSWRYSLSIDVLGAILEKISGKSLGALVKEYVTTPLQMKNTDFKVVDTSKQSSFYANTKAGVEKMYDGIFVPLENAGVTFAPSRILNPKSYNSGGGGMAGTAQDLLKFFETIRLNEGKILKKETVNKMMKDQVGEQAETQGPGWGFGYGWAVLDDASKTNSPLSNGTIQWGGAYGHRWFIDPAKKLTIIALTNTTFEGMNGQFPEDVTKAIYEVMNTENQNTVSIYGHLFPKKGKSAALKSSLLKTLQPSKNEEGNIIYNLHEEKDGSFFLYEVWRSQEDWEKDYIKT